MICYLMCMSKTVPDILWADIARALSPVEWALVAWSVIQAACIGVLIAKVKFLEMAVSGMEK